MIHIRRRLSPVPMVQRAHVHTYVLPTYTRSKLDIQSSRHELEALACSSTHLLAPRLAAPLCLLEGQTFPHLSTES